MKNLFERAISPPALPECALRDMKNLFERAISPPALPECALRHDARRAGRRPIDHPAVFPRGGPLRSARASARTASAAASGPVAARTAALGALPVSKSSPSTP